MYNIKMYCNSDKNQRNFNTLSFNAIDFSNNKLILYDSFILKISYETCQIAEKTENSP